MKSKIIIGRTDKVDFPEFNLYDIDVKIDTGAYTSSIHCHQIEERMVDGKKVVKFELLDPLHPQYSKQVFIAANYKEKRIKNSFGISEKRFVINTFVRLFDKDYPIELSLGERGDMKFPVLIGRKLLKGKFIVDPSKYNLSNRKIKTVIKLESNRKK